MRTVVNYTLLLCVCLTLAACGGDKENVTIVNAKDGLDLRVLPDLVRKAKDAKGFEKLLNEPGQKVNNLDLDEDGKVDYIKVTEFGDAGDLSKDKTKAKKQGFSLTVNVGGQEQEVAVIEVELKGDQATVQTRGNRHIYGHNNYYHRSYGGSSFLMWYYLSRSHTPYYSRYGRGSYPSYYSSQPPQPKQTYRNNTSTMAKNSGVKQSSGAVFAGSAPSPNSGKNSSYVKAPLASPNAAQKSYQSRNPSKYSSSRSGRSGSSGRSGGSRGGK